MAAPTAAATAGVAAGASASDSAASSAAGSSCVVDEELIRSLVCGMLSQDPSQLRATVARHYAPGAVLYHYLTRAATAVDMYRVYRSYNFGFRSRPVIRDIIIDTQPRNLHQGAAAAATSQQTAILTGPGKQAAAAAGAAGAAAAAAPPPPEGCVSAAVWLDQHVTPKGWPLPLPAAVVPTIVLLKFRPCPETGRPLVYEQYDHVSLYGFIWSFGAPSLWLFEHVLAPAVMYGMGAVAYGLDFAEESWRFVRQQIFNLPPPDGGADGGAACAGGGSGAACGYPRGIKAGGGGGGGDGGGGIFGRRAAEWAAAKELPGVINHAATGYGLAGERLDGGDLLLPK
ncbi:hypothetical protein PLESTB_000766100 [Pleodorina starrii]|uniref:Uncharacterized protein n=1 Tax=Pleodorina starrii TaxID=330485 RepID=A0A9W6BKT9_9CHLO|nr:hypothetical protein PLESTM_000439200 [Pleodorina starrii]GLC53590.1 hypothetical protein PLESTB_000766100 [Pleodorina starrii]